ncbi:hypothetical protein [Sinosporangium siamense]|uniref:Uncharacterized protein n=1 Tax=Sinosporangium siamense TaxID=1367973 RepID=A0A919RNM0_9ACTN|nr:hypothetical protein [Sinosporangium siamense]GII95516.1 hypothetical protein Ssi02_57470 [Sinosporangium siamense]
MRGSISVGAPLVEAERGDVDRITASLSKAVGEAAFETAFAAGADPAAGPEGLVE